MSLLLLYPQLLWSGRTNTGWKEFLGITQSLPFSVHALLGQVAQVLTQLREVHYPFSENWIPPALIPQGWNTEENTGILQKNGKTASKFHCRQGNQHSTLSRRNLFLQKVILKTLKCIKNGKNKTMKNFLPTTTSKDPQNFKTHADSLHKANKKEIHLNLAVDCYEVLILWCSLQRLQEGSLKRKLSPGNWCTMLTKHFWRLSK